MKIVSSQTNIRNAIFDQRSTRPPEVGVSRWHRQTHRQTDGHGDSMTNSAQWGRVGENTLGLYIFESLRQETKILFENSELNFESLIWSSLCRSKMDLDIYKDLSWFNLCSVN